MHAHMHGAPPAAVQGQTDVKEGHFHAQCPGVVLSAGAEGLHIFKPDLETRPDMDA
jgi:hypothetical protein